MALNIKGMTPPEIPPGTELSDRDVWQLYNKALSMQAEEDRKANAAPAADSRMNNLSAYTTNAQIAELAQGNTEATRAFTLRRDNLWDTQNSRFEQDVQGQKLKLGELAIQRAQTEAQRAEEDLIAEQNRNLAAEFLMPVSHAKAMEELRELENKNRLTENELARQDYYKDLLTKPEPQKSSVTPATTANTLLEVESIQDAGPAWDSIRELEATHNVPAATLNQLYTGRLAITYTTPMEMVKDIGINPPDSNVIAINAVDTQTTGLIDDALAKNMPPDKALKQVITDLGLDKASKEYKQKTVDLAYAVMKRYNDAGEAALKDAQAAIAAHNERMAQSAASQLQSIPQQVSTSAGVLAILNSTQQAMQDLLTASESAKAGGTGSAPYSAMLEEKAYGKAGISPMMAEAMQPEQIRKAVMQHLIKENEGDLQFTSWMQDQAGKPPAQRDPRLETFLDAIVTPFNKGYEQARQEEIKKAEQRDKITMDNLEKGLITEWDVAGKPVTFSDPARAQEYRTADTSKRMEIAAKEKDRIESEITAWKGNETFRSLPPADQAEIRSDIEAARLLLASDTVDPNSGFMKEKGLRTKKEVQSWMEGTIKANGFKIDVPEIAGKNDEKGFFGRLFGFWRGDNEQAPAIQQPASTPATQQPNMVERGNIDLSSRPKVNMPDGKIATIRSISIEENGVEVLIPTVVNGRIVSDQDAVRHYKTTGEHLGKFSTIDDANEYAEQLHLNEAKKEQIEQPQPATDIPLVKSRAEAEALPPGTSFRTPDGSIMKVPERKPADQPAQPGQQSAQPEVLITDEMLETIKEPVFTNEQQRQRIEREALDIKFDEDMVKRLAGKIIKRVGNQAIDKISTTAKSIGGKLLGVVNAVNYPVELLGGTVLDTVKSVDAAAMKAIDAIFLSPTERREMTNKAYVKIVDMLRKEYIREQLEKENRQ